MFEGQIWLWIGFNLFVLAMLALDLGVFHRKSHAVSTKEAITWSVVWISLSLVFNVVIYFLWDRMMPGSSYTNSEAALAFLTGYLIEKSLSVDNIFVFILIFSFFAVPAAYQHRVLFWAFSVRWSCVESSSSSAQPCSRNSTGSSTSLVHS